ncbi:hypothetical protein [uncultured Eudoraea sp.]|uniref:hypothetical protein n=1 Tax=uncultured Eudoraea sp. TaxID=1035614 RepID=UPI00262A11E6|nr:hypothetical protein [uncultured Eudoraea sp.]
MPINVNTSIGNNDLPRNLSNPNEFVSYANSFILMPMLGPLNISKRIRSVLQAIYYLNKFVDLMDLAIDVAIKNNLNGINIKRDLGREITHRENEDIVLTTMANRLESGDVASAILAPVTNTIRSTTSGNLSRLFTPIRAVAINTPASILIRPLSELNPVFDLAFDAEKIAKTGVLVSVSDVRKFKGFGRSRKLKYIYILEKFLNPSTIDLATMQNYLPLFKKGGDYANEFGPNTARDLLNGGRQQVDKKGQKLITGFLFDILDFDFDNYGGKVLGDVDANSSEMEWALIRKDKITVTLGQKLLRGPIETISVSPNATSNVSSSFESIVSSQLGNEDVSSSSIVTRQSRSIADNIATSITNSVESGARNQASFNNSSIIRNSMTERLSSASREELRIISQMNRLASIASTEERTSRSSMYETKGVDLQLSNTEVLFESFVKTTVKSEIDDIGLVWSPRIYAPYISINRQINRAAQQARLDYIRINYVIDPAEPPLHYERQEVYDEKSAKGRNRSQEYNKTITIPANLTSEEWELDQDNIEVGFRNGTSDDYDWKERGNWDDLENWSATLLSFNRRGNEVDVRVRLETTDPEYWNKGFITISLYFEKLTEESKSALSAYERQIDTSRFERRSVKVRARQLADLKKQELIENTIKSPEEIKKILVYNLLRQITLIEKRKNISLYYEALKSCLDWGSVHYENEVMSNPPFPLYPHDHFTNTNAARLFLPVRKEKEEDFKKLVKHFATSVYAAEIDSVVDMVRQRRSDIQNTPAPAALFSYEDEIVLGIHRENMFSNTNFKFV